jgi:hypothetical protein
VTARFSEDLISQKTARHHRFPIRMLVVAELPQYLDFEEDLFGDFDFPNIQTQKEKS